MPFLPPKQQCQSTEGVEDLREAAPSHRMATTTTRARRRMKTMMAQMGATIQSRLTPSWSTFDSTTALPLSGVATVHAGAADSFCIASTEYGDDM